MVAVPLGVGVRLGRRVGVEIGVCVFVGVNDWVGKTGVRVGRKVGVYVGVGDWYQRGVGVRVRVGGTIAEGIANASGG
jgi:hypothetical protein